MSVSQLEITEFAHMSVQPVPPEFDASFDKAMRLRTGMVLPPATEDVARFNVFERSGARVEDTRLVGRMVIGRLGSNEVQTRGFVDVSETTAAARAALEALVVEGLAHLQARGMEVDEGTLNYTVGSLAMQAGVPMTGTIYDHASGQLLGRRPAPIAEGVY